MKSAEARWRSTRNSGPMAFMAVLLLICGCGFLQEQSTLGMIGSQFQSITTEIARAVITKEYGVVNDKEEEYDKIDGKVLVVYSGPTNVGKDSKHPYSTGGKKNELYFRNFNYFLDHGVDCRAQDTALVITKEVLPLYETRIKEMDMECQRHGHKVFLVLRENRCFDMESMRVVLFESPEINRSSYDYLVYANCGTTGPSKDWPKRPWVNTFTSLLTDKIKMVGLTHHCQGNPHIQSMMYCLDKAGLEVVIKAKAIFNCHDVNNGTSKEDLSKQHGLVINRYEKGMGRHIVEAGYAIAPFLRYVSYDKDNATNCSIKDLWISSNLKEYYGRIPSLNETLFFKTSRYLSEETAREINYTGLRDWNW